MRNFKISLVASISIHLVLFFISQNRVIKKNPRKQEIKIKVKERAKRPYKRSSLSNNKKKTKIENLNFSMFAVKKSAVKLNESRVLSNSDLQVGEANHVFSEIEKNLLYPAELVEIGASGSFSVKFYLDKDGNYLENRTKISEGTRFLRVYIARVLRKSLINMNRKLKLSKLTQFDATFKFQLSTSHVKLESSQVLKNRYFFYRQNYGISTGRDKVMNGLTKTLTGISNIFSLLQYLPDSDKTKLRKKRLLENYINDPFY